jgi:hypothetical protein
MEPRVCALALALAFAGCGGQEVVLGAGCTDEPETLVRALEKAPGAVVLADGSRLSDCVRNARSDGELQNVGIAMSRAADRLFDRAEGGDVQAAVALGYLTGAARRGGDRTNGVGVELVRRIELRAGSLARAGGTVADGVRRGLGAGQASG